MKKTILTVLLALGFTLVFSCGGSPAVTETEIEDAVEQVIEEEVFEEEAVEEEAVEE